MAASNASRPASRPDNNIDALRGLAVAAVVCHHLFVYTGLKTPLLGEVGGLLGVELFFLISGYLIVQSARAYPLSGYLVRRALRIFPAYWLVLLALSAWRGKLDPGELAGHGQAFLLNFLALTHLSPTALQRFDVLTVSWTLTIELAWYALAPLVVWLAPRRQPAGFWLGAAAVALIVSCAWVALAQAGRLDWLYAEAIARVGVRPVDDFMRYAFIVNAFPAQLVFFLMGCLIWRFGSQLTRIRSGLLWAVLVAFAPFPTQWNTWLHLNPSFAPGIGLAALFVLALKHRPLPLRLAHWLGRVSYPVYLIHVPVILAVFERGKLTGPAGLLLALVLILALSGLLHRWVEQPGIALGRHLARCA